MSTERLGRITLQNGDTGERTSVSLDAVWKSTAASKDAEQAVSVALPLPEAVREQDRLNDIRRRWQAVLEAHRNNEVDVLNREHHASWDDIRFLLTALATAEAAAQQERARLEAAAHEERTRRDSLWIAEHRQAHAMGYASGFSARHDGQTANADFAWKQYRAWLASHPPPTPENR